MDQQLKQRLIGASVVVALAVIVVPELVKQQPEENAPAAANEIPPRPVIEPAAISGQSDSDQSTVLVLPGAEPLPEQANDQEMATSAPLGTEESPVAEALIEERAVEERAVTVTAQAIPDPVIVEQAESEPLPSSQDAIESASPEPAVAESPAPVHIIPRQSSEEQRLQPAKPIVPARQLEPQPTAPAAVARQEPSTNTNNESVPVELPKIQLISRAEYGNSQPSQQVSKDPRWMVQAGSFYVAENASMLREKLRQQSFPATLQTAEVEGRTVYRVQVGPHATRAEGERTRERLLRDAGIKGNVVPVYN